MNRVVVTCLLALGACLSVPEAEKPMCAVTADCNQAAGEICDEGVCWGDPPPGPFAAIASPPSTRGADLVSSELLELPISDDGWTADIRLEEPFSYTAQLACVAPLACTDAELGATITVTRPSLFPGGPGFKTVVSADDTDPFEINVPRTGHGPFTVTVIPDGRDESNGPTPAKLIPPMRFTLDITGTTGGERIELGGNGPTIGGYVRDASGAGQLNYRVVALGRWEANAPATEVSTVDYTGSDGKFTLRLATGLVGSIEIVAKPITIEERPTLRVSGVSATQSTTTVQLAVPTEVGQPTPVTLAFQAVDDNGSVVPARGARVTISGRYNASTSAAATVEVSGTTDENGVVTLTVLDGAAFRDSYRVSVVPPASAKFAALFDEPLPPAPTRMILLPTRLALRGVVYDQDGEPVKDVSVTARPSLRFLWTLDAVPQRFLTAIPASTAITPNTGEWVVWVDANIADTWGNYDVVFEPPADARVPSWVVSDIEIPRSVTQDTVTLPTTTLPDAAFVRGTVYDPDGNPVDGADLKIYRVPTDLDLCMEVKNPPASCSIPAQLMGRGTADSRGRVELTLPRP